MTAAVVVRDLHKHYGDNRAVDGVSFEIEEGEVFALLGPNGAGKSTTVEILEGHRSRTSGEVEVLGYDPGKADREFRDRIGVVLQESGIEKELSVREVLTMTADVYRNPRDIDEVIEVVGLDEKADSRVKTLSGGQQRRIDLALGLIGDPDLIFLDEPTTGFDPSARRRSWDLVDNLRSLGRTILLTTHYMDEAEHLADRVAVIAAGKIVAEGTPASLAEATSDTVVQFRLPASVSASSLPVTPSRVDGPTIEVTAESPTRTLHQLTGWAIDNGIELDGLRVARATLEDVYLQLIASGDGSD